MEPCQPPHQAKAGFFHGSMPYIAWTFLARVPEISSKPALGNPVRVINVVAPEDPGSQS